MISRNEEIIINMDGGRPVALVMPVVRQDSRNLLELKWIPSTLEEIAQATIRMIKVASPHSSGKSCNPDTDFSKI